jgi:aminoglycoside 2'-N-acetyltransferase I
LTPSEIKNLRSLLWRAFGDDDFDEDDWGHALGGWHVLAEDGDQLMAHAAVVRRTLEVGGEPWDTGYVEAVASVPVSQGRGIATQVMTIVGQIISENHQLGALGTGLFHFYERLGWQRWRGPSGVRTVAGTERTSEDDGFIMVLLTEASRHLDLAGLITCDWRPGDVW